MTPRYAVLDAPTNLGIKPTGVQFLPDALRAAGIVERLQARDAGRLKPPPYNPVRDAVTGLLNPHGILHFSLMLQTHLLSLFDRGEFPVVLGGDCSILLGCMLALRRRGRYGLVHVDGHADFYLPEQTDTGEAADCDLALVTGRGPDIVTDIDGLRPYVRDQDAITLGYRDAEESAAIGSSDIRLNSAIHAFDLAAVRAMGAENAAAHALDQLAGERQFWIHLDADVLDDAVMPAVEYRLPGGLSPDELVSVLHRLIASGRAVGIGITIYNPNFDSDGSAGRLLTDLVVRGLTGR